MEISVTVNGAARTADVEPRMLLAHVIREEFGLTGTHVGCDTTSCGACTVLLDGSPVKSCTMFGVQADGRDVTTVEGLADAADLHPVQAAFQEEHGLQCGFCTPGMMLVGAALLERNPDPSDDGRPRSIWPSSRDTSRPSTYPTSPFAGSPSLNQTTWQ